MFKGNRNLAVGLFVSVALAGVAGFAMWLAGTTGNEAVNRYSLLFERDVSGLSMGGPVYYLGVGVGSVINMDLEPGNPIKVRVDISVLADTPIDSGSYASLNAQGITGVTVINIAGEPGDHGPIEPTDDFEYPLIPVRHTGLSALLSEAPNTVAKLNLALDQVNQILGEENRERIGLLLQHVESVAASLAEEREALAGLPREIASLARDTKHAVSDVRELMQEVRPDLAGTLDGANRTMQNLSQLSARIDSLLADHETEFEHFIDNGIGQAPELIFEMRSTLRELQKLIIQLQEDPSQLIHRPPDNALEVNP